MGVLPSEFWRLDRHIIACISGVIGGLLPTDKSNIHPLLMGAILAFLATKVLVGDYDRGYQWTLSDLVFGVTTISEGILGARLVSR